MKLGLNNIGVIGPNHTLWDSHVPIRAVVFAVVNSENYFVFGARELHI